MSSTPPQPPKRGFSLRIFVPDGSPDGLRVVEKSNWTGIGVIFPRALHSSAKARPEFDRPGIYLLLGPAEETGLPLLYIGEGDPVRPRLDSHAAKKDFWTSAILFTSKDANLNKARIQYLESRLVEIAADAKRCQLDNGNRPALPSLSEADIAETESFLDEVLLCLPVLGVQLFEKPPVVTAAITELYLRASDGITATGYEAAQGFVVRAGSKARFSETPAIHAYMAALRKDIIANGIFVPDGPAFRFTADYTFLSPSTAAGVILGRAANGRTEWQTADGRTLKALQEAQSESGAS